jgi:uncharacterized protein (TIGR03437 family)
MHRAALYLTAGTIVAQLHGAVVHQDLLATQPLRFEENQGQIPGGTGFVARGPHYLLEIQAGENSLTWANTSSKRTGNVRTRLVGANRNARLEGREPLESHTSYFLGASQMAWHAAVPNFGRVQASVVYPGVDLVFYGASGKLEYDFVVKPGANPRQIQLDLEGIPNVSIAPDGDLVLESAAGEVRWKKPLIYQTVGESRKVIPGGFKRIAKRRIGFQIGQYDVSRALIIDPVMNYASYYGGAGNDFSRAIGADSAGNVYIAGATSTPALKTTPGVLQPAYGGETTDVYTGDAFIAKFTPAGALVYVTYLGGSADDLATGIAVDAAGNVYVTGYTNSLNFPTTTGAFQSSFGGFGGNSCNPLGDAFVAKVNPSGTQLIYSTYLGGSLDDAGFAIAIDAVGNAYVAGTTRSTNFPVTPGVVQTKFAGGGGEPGASSCGNLPQIDTGDAFVAKLNPSGSQLLFSTFLGGNQDDAALGIAIDSSSNVYVAGATLSHNFPTTPGVFQNTYHGVDFQNEFLHFGDGFITKLNSTATALLYSTYLGGSGDDVIYSITVDGQGDAYVAGSTSSPDFPVTAKAVQPAYAGYYNLPFLVEQLVGDGFVTEVNPTGTALSYSTYLGGADNDVAYAVAVDSTGLMYVAGSTDSQNFPVTGNAFQFNFRGDGGQGAYWPVGDGFLTIINPNSTTLVYSTYFGGTMDDMFMGLTFDPSGNLWMVGNTVSINLPVTMTAAQSSYGGSASTQGIKGDAMLAKFTALPAAPQPAASVANALNGASFSTAIAPGSLLTVFGVFPGVATTSAPGLPLPDILGGTSVTINGEPAPLNYVNGTQINTQVPWDVAPGPATVIVTTGGLASEPFQASTFQFTVVPTGPGIFTYGANLAVAQNADYTLNSTSDPAKVGSFVIVYMTGGGDVDPTVPTGSATPVTPVSYVKANSSATIGGKPAKVLFLGMAPYFVGIVQADVEIPDLSKGTYPVVVTVGGVKSNGAMVSVSAK